MERIRVALCDDMEDLCRSYEELFESYDDLEFIGYALNSGQCIKLVSEKKPDILLLDVCIDEQETGINLIPSVLEHSEKTKVIMLTGFQNENYIFKAFVNGASDYVAKSLSFDDIVKTIRNAYKGDVSINSETSRMLVKKTKEVSESAKSILFLLNKFIQLTPTEYEVLRCFYNGDTYKKIAKQKYVEETTVRTLGSRILKKFEFPTMSELVKYLRETKVIEFIESGKKE